jgi:phosphatidate phosphatase APP1
MTAGFKGLVYRIEDSGLSVICDIDDTVRITGVGDRESLIRSTFFESFKPVPEVRAQCSELAAAGAQFHYVSASPWQLYEPLERFLRDEGFPAGSFHLKAFRLKDSTFLSLFDNPEIHKRPIIEGLIQRWPGRRFVLIGDTGERDPELYGDIARRFPQQVERVYLRDLRNSGRGDPRLKEALREVPAEKWVLITTPQRTGAGEAVIRSAPHAAHLNRRNSAWGCRVHRPRLFGIEAKPACPLSGSDAAGINAWRRPWPACPRIPCSRRSLPYRRP